MENACEFGIAKKGKVMENVLLTRVDDRLIHGQVMTAWMKRLPAKEIMVIDNKIAKDEFMIKGFIDQGIDVKIQVIPDDKVVNVKDVI